MAPTALALGEGVGVFLHYLDTNPPVLDAKVQAQAIPCAEGPRTYGEGAGVSLNQPQEYHIVKLRSVLYLTDRQPDPVDCGFCPMHVL